MRLVVTGQTSDGKSVVVSDRGVEPIELGLLPGTGFHRLWGGNSPPLLPTDGSPPDATGYFPPPGGYRFGFFTMGPESMPLPEYFDLEEGMEELDRRLPGLSEVMDPDHPGMHTTDTVDVDLIISGEIWLELDDGKEVNLQAGDTVVLNGTRHSWHNRSDEPCVVFSVFLGAERSSP
jgi:mannose-6-phosphate isomerase-like protein (cupin superfamily)